VAALARVGDIEESRLLAGLDDAFALVAGRFFRREVRARARACLAGMLSGLERKTGWSLAEHAGERSPDGMQRLFTTARWDHDAVRDDLRGWVAADEAYGDLLDSAGARGIGAAAAGEGGDDVVAGDRQHVAGRLRHAGADAALPVTLCAARGGRTGEISA